MASTAQHLACMKVRHARKSGQLRLLEDGRTACVDCGKPAQVYDHRDYSKPLDVQPVCKRCNRLRGPAIGWTPNNKNSDGTEKLTIWIDANIKQQAKLKALANRTTMSVVIEDLLYSYLGSMKEARKYARQRDNGKGN